jgi:hypothetical protein
MAKYDKKDIFKIILNSDFDQLGITIQGLSMSPALFPGDKVYIRKGLYWPGDIVVFWEEDLLVVHRLLGWWFSPWRWYIVSKGDNKPSLDRRVPWTHVLGKVMYWERDGQNFRETFVCRMMVLLRSMGGYLATRFRNKTRRETRSP